MHHGAGDPAAARRFTRTSPRDVDQLSATSDGGGGGDSPACRLGADGRCASPVALPRYPPPAMLIIRRRCWGPIVGRERRRVRSVIAPPLRAPAGDPSRRCKYVLGRNRESRSRPGNCDSRSGNAISRELTSLIRRGFSVLLCSFLGERYPKIYFALYSMLQFYGFSVCYCLHQVAKMALLCNVLLFLRLFFFGIMILLT